MVISLQIFSYIFTFQLHHQWFEKVYHFDTNKTNMAFGEMKQMKQEAFRECRHLHVCDYE